MPTALPPDWERISADGGPSSSNTPGSAASTGPEHHRDFWTLTDDGPRLRRRPPRPHRPGRPRRPARRLPRAAGLSRGACRCCSALRGRGLKTAILSNGEPGMLDAARRRRRPAGPARRRHQRRGHPASSSPTRASTRLADQRFGAPAARMALRLAATPGTPRAPAAPASASSGATAPASPPNTASTARATIMRSLAELEAALSSAISALTPAARLAAAIELLAEIEARPATPRRRRRQRFLPRPPLHRLGRPPRRVGPRLARAAHLAPARLVARPRAAAPRHAAPAGRRLAAARELGPRRAAQDLLRRPVRARRRSSRVEAAVAAPARSPHARPPRHARSRCGSRCRTGSCRARRPASATPSSPRCAPPSTRRRSTCASTCSKPPATAAQAALAAEGLDADAHAALALGPAHRRPPRRHLRRRLPVRPGRDPGRRQPARRRPGRRRPRDARGRLVRRRRRQDPGAGHDDAEPRPHRRLRRLRPPARRRRPPPAPRRRAQRRAPPARARRQMGQAPRRHLRPRAGRRPLHRHRHLAPQPGRPHAPASERDLAELLPKQAGILDAAARLGSHRRTPYLRHLLVADRGERGAGGALPCTLIRSSVCCRWTRPGPLAGRPPHARARTCR